MDNTKVRCYSGRAYAERPVAFEWEGTEYGVEEIEKEWLEPGERHFRVRVGGNKLFRLCYNEGEDKWKIGEIPNTKL